MNWLFEILEFYKASSPQEQAAMIAGIVAVFSAFLSAGLTYRIHREKLRLDRDVDKVRAVRNHLEETDGLLHRVSVSFGRLGRMAPDLSEDDMLAETTNTLDVYAEYTRHLSNGSAISYPADVADAIATVQKEISRLFLDLRRPGDARGLSDFRTLIAEDVVSLGESVSLLSERIRKHIRVAL